MGRQQLLRDDLIGQIYDAAENPRGIDAVLGEIAKGFRSEKHHLFVMAPDHGTSELWFTGSHEADIVAYHERFQDIDPRLQVGARYPGRAHSDAEAIDPAEFERSVIYHELLRPLDIRYTLFANFDVEPGVVAGHSYMRSAREGAFDRHEVRQFDAILGHLARALRLRRVISSVRNQLLDLRRALDTLWMPVAILDEAARLICANEGAERLLNAEHGLLVKQQTLSATSLRDTRAIADAVSQTCRLGRAQGTKTAVMAVPAAVEIQRSDRAPLSLVFMPLRDGHSIMQADASARVLLVVNDPESIRRVDPLLVGRLHGLTSTEALLASALAEGKTLAEFALDRGCSEQTARTHLKRVLEKTQTRRQAELVRLLLGSAAAHLATSS